MDKELYQIAWRALSENYKGEIDLGTTEFTLVDRIWKNKKIKMLLIPGTNELKDWKKNFDLRSIKGIKKVGVDAWDEIVSNEHFDGTEPLIIVVHSKSGATGVAFARYAKKHELNWKVISFNPARSMRYWTDRKFNNMVVFRNAYDAVSELLGFISFCHPKCKTYINKNSREHKLYYWKEFIDDLPK